MIETDILKTLQRSVTTAVGTTVPVKYIGVNFKKPSNDKFWEIVYIPNNVKDEFWSSGKTYRGILRLILHWPQNNKGIYEAMNEVKRVAEYYTKDIELFLSDEITKIRITNEPDLTNVIEDEGSLLLPLTITYSCFKM